MEETNNKIETYLDKKISNLNVNYQKLYEITKCNTKIVMNSLGSGMIVLGVAHLSFNLLPPLLLIPGGFIIYKTIKNAKIKHDNLLKQKSLLKKK